MEAWQQYHDGNGCTCHRTAAISLYGSNNDANCFYEWVNKDDEYVLPNIEWHHNHNKSTAYVRQVRTRYLLKMSIRPQGTKIKSLLRWLGELRDAEH